MYPWQTFHTYLHRISIFFNSVFFPLTHIGTGKLEKEDSYYLNLKKGLLVLCFHTRLYYSIVASTLLLFSFKKEDRIISNK